MDNKELDAKLKAQGTDLAKKYDLSPPESIDPKSAIMVVEDQQDVRLIIVHQLRKLNFSNLVQVKNGYEAIETIHKTRITISAFICAMDLPILGGVDLLLELQEDTKLERAPFCITLMEPNKDKIMLAAEKGADEVLVKPFTLEDIGSKLMSAYKKYHFPGNPEKLYELAKRLLNESELEKSWEVYDDLRKSSPNSARPLLGLARIALAEGDYPKSLQLLNKAEQKNKFFVHNYSERANVYCQLKRWGYAATSFLKAIELSPLNPVRYQSAAEILLELKRYKEVSTLLESGIQQGISITKIYQMLGQAKFALKEYKAAAKCIRQGLKEDPENLMGLNKLAVCLAESGEVVDALKAYNTIIKINPQDANAQYSKAILQHKNGDAQAAIRTLKRLGDKHPGFDLGEEKLAEFQKEVDAA